MEFKKWATDAKKGTEVEALKAQLLHKEKIKHHLCQVQEHVSMVKGMQSARMKSRQAGHA